jgi:hypothetical protein
MGMRVYSKVDQLAWRGEPAWNFDAARAADTYLARWRYGHRRRTI